MEERIEGEDFRSPSVQLRMSPAGQVDIMSTHDQILGGAHGQTYFGCHFPADPGYAALIAAEALKVGRRLAREGVIGRAGVDFATVQRSGSWEPYALEVNLRCGGTTHPLFALTSLTDGVYEPLAGEWRTRSATSSTTPRPTTSTRPRTSRSRPTTCSTSSPRRASGGTREREVGVVLHMVSAIAVAGRIGLTAIGDTLDEARQRYYGVKAAVDVAAS